MPEDASAQTNNDEPRKKAFSFTRLVASLIALSIAGYLGWAFYIAFFGLEVVTERTEEVLQTTTFERFELRDVTFSEAVEIYRQALQGRGVSEIKVRVRTIEGETVDTPANQRTSISLTNLPAIEAGKYVAVLFDRDFYVYGNEIRIHAKGQRPLIRRTIRINPNFVPREQVTLNADGSYDMREFLKSLGITFQNGAWAKLHPSTGKLEVYLPRNEIELADVILNSGCTIGQLTWRDRAVLWIRSWF